MELYNSQLTFLRETAESFFLDITFIDIDITNYDEFDGTCNKHNEPILLNIDDYNYIKKASIISDDIIYCNLHCDECIEEICDNVDDFRKVINIVTDHKHFTYRIFGYDNDRLNMSCPSDHDMNVSFTRALMFNEDKHCGCIECYKDDYLTTAELHFYELLLIRKFEINEGTFKDLDSKFNLICNKGHKILTSYKGFRRSKVGCKVCTGNCQEQCKKNLTNIAISKGGKFYPETYINAYTQAKFICSFNHEFWSKASDVRDGCWCSRCSKNNASQCLEKGLKIIENKGGIFLQDSYINNRKKCNIICKKGHEFSMSIKVVNRGSFCPICKESKGELKIYDFLKNTNYKFEVETYVIINNINVKFDFVIDLYKIYKIYIEFDGEQHFKRNKFFHKEEGSFESSQYRDTIKQKYVLAAGDAMIRIAYTDLDIMDDEFLQSLIDDAEAGTTLYSDIDMYKSLPLYEYSNATEL